MNKLGIKILSLLIVLCMMLSFVACSSQKADNNADNQNTNDQNTIDQSEDKDSASLDEKDPLGKYAEPIEVTAVGVLHPVEGEVPEGTTPENQSFNKMAEDFLNIKLKYLWTVTPDQYDQKFNISIASGQVPDLIHTSQTTQFENLVESDLLADLTEAYDYLLPELKKMYEEDVPEVIDSVKRDGKLLALPTAANKFEAAQRLYIRKDWLEKLNLEVPTNYDELVKVAEAFVKEDPDGNGKADTIGLALHKNITWGGSFGSMPFFEMFHAYPGRWLKDDSGNIYDGTTTPEVKNALAAYQDLYNRGIIDKEFATKDDGMVVEDIIAGKIGMVFGEWWIPEWPLGITVTEVEGSDWVPIAVPSSDDKPALPAVERVAHNGFNAVSKTSKNPEAAVKLINLFYDAFYNADAAEKYGDLVKPENGFFHNFVPQKLWDVMASTDEFWRNNEAIKTRDPSKLPPRELNNHYVRSVALLDEGDKSGWGIYNCMVADDSGYSYVAELAEKKNVIYNEFYGAPTPTMIEKGDTLGNLAAETFIRIIMGEPISEFDKFVDEYKKLGGEDLEKEVNEWYKDLHK